MSGRHPWKKLFEETFSPEQRARINRDADKIVVDSRRRRASAPVARPSASRPTSRRTEQPEVASRRR